MPRPSLTRTRVISAGTSVVIELGLPALDVRTVARRVNATSTGVQRLIGPSELVRSVVEEITTSMPPVPARGDWLRRARIWAFETRSWLTGYAGLAEYLIANRWDVPVALDRLEEVVEVLQSTGLGSAHAEMSGITLYLFILSSAELDESARVIGGEVVKLRSGLPKRWPRLGACIDDYSAAAAHTQFAFGLEVLLRGIERGIDDGGSQSEVPQVLRQVAAPDRRPGSVLRV